MAICIIKHWILLSIHHLRLTILRVIEMFLVIRPVFTKEILDSLEGNVALGHVLYSNEKVEEKNIDIASEYLVMASELIHLKSKLLINRKDEEESAEDEFSFSSEEDLRNK